MTPSMSAGPAAVFANLLASLGGPRWAAPLGNFSALGGDTFCILDAVTFLFRPRGTCLRKCVARGGGGTLLVREPVEYESALTWAPLTRVGLPLVGCGGPLEWRQTATKLPSTSSQAPERSAPAVRKILSRRAHLDCARATYHASAMATPAAATAMSRRGDGALVGSASFAVISAWSDGKSMVGRHVSGR